MFGMETIELFRKLVSIPSVFGNEQQISKFLTDYLKNIGFSVRHVLTEKVRNNIVATYGKNKKYLTFFGHMDTVHPSETVADPFVAKIIGKKAYGLGTEDMKGGITAILKTAEYAVKNNLPMKIIFGVDEEGPSEGAYDLVKSGFINDIDFLIEGESGQVKDITKPFNVIYGRKGRAAIKVIITGKKAHAAEQHKGINAIDQAIKFMLLVKKMKFPKHPRLGNTDIVFQIIHGNTDSSFSIPEKCELAFSFLTTPVVTIDKFCKQLKILANKNDIKAEIGLLPRKTPYADSYEVDIKNKFLKLLEKNIFIPSKVTPMYTPSVADGNIFANELKIPVISIGPVGGGGHSPDEWVDIESIKKVEKTYQIILELYHNK